MKQVRIYSVEIQTLFVLERHFYCDMYFTLKCGDLICSSDIIHTAKPKTDIRAQFEIIPRAIKDWSISIDFWDYNLLTQGPDRQPMGQGIIDLTSIQPGSQFSQMVPLFHPITGSKEIELQIRIGYIKDTWNMTVIDPKKLPYEREMQRMVHMINLEQESSQRNLKVQVQTMNGSQLNGTAKGIDNITKTPQQPSSQLQVIPLVQERNPRSPMRQSPSPYLPHNRAIRSRTPEILSQAPYQQQSSRNRSPGRQMGIPEIQHQRSFNNSNLQFDLQRLIQPTQLPRGIPTNQQYFPQTWYQPQKKVFNPQ